MIPLFVFHGKSFFSDRKKITFDQVKLNLQLVFLIGILSSPLLYMFAIFTYLLAFSFGLFSSSDNLSNEESYTSNLLNYEELNSVASITAVEETCNYIDFLNSEKSTFHAIEFGNIFFASKKAIILLPELYLVPMEYQTASSLTNRPPPVFSC